MKYLQRHLIYRLTFVSVLILAVYYNTLNHGFVWDDSAVIVDNSMLGSLKNLPKLFIQEDSIHYYRPLTYVSFLIDRSIWGLNPLGFNITNLILHIAVALTFYLLMAELFKRKDFAFIATLIFSLHPIANETVNFHAGGRNTLLCALFSLLAFLFHIRRKIPVSTVCFFLAVFSKEFALMIPIAFLFYDRCLSVKKMPTKNYAYYIAVIIGYLTIRSYAVTSPNFFQQINLINLLILSPELVVRYLSNMVYPLNLQTMYDITPVGRTIQIISFIVIIVFIISAAIYFRKKREIFFSTGWFFLFLLPVSGILPTGITSMADRYVYFSSMGFAMALAYVINLASKKSVITIMVLLCAWYAAIDIHRNSFWKDQLSLFEQMVKDAPQMGVAYQNLGNEYYEKGDIDNAVKNLSIAYTKNSINPKMMIGSASIFWEAKQYDKAINVLKVKLQFNPSDPITYIMLSRIYGESGNEAMEKLFYNKAEQLFPQIHKMMRQRVESLCLETDELIEKHDLEGAERILREAQEIDPNAMPVLIDLGVLSAEKGNLNKSLRFLTKALLRDPNNPPVHYNLSILYQMMGKKTEGKEEMRKFRQLSVNPAQNKMLPQ